MHPFFFASLSGSHCCVQHEYWCHLLIKSAISCSFVLKISQLVCVGRQICLTLRWSNPPVTFNILNEEKVPGATIPPYCNCCSDCCSGLFSGGRGGSQGQIRGIQQKMKIICTCPSVLSIIWNGLAQMSLYVFECACMEGSTGTWSRFTYRHGVNRCWPLFTLQKLPSTLD